MLGFNFPYKMSSQIYRIFTPIRSVVYKGFTKNLLFSNTLTCGLLLTGGDLIQQRIERYMGYQQSYDLNRGGKIFFQTQTHCLGMIYYVKNKQGGRELQISPQNFVKWVGW